MSKEFIWTDQKVIDFIRFTNKKERDFTGYYSDLDEFKSQQPVEEKEYEILSLSFEGNIYSNKKANLKTKEAYYNDTFTGWVSLEQNDIRHKETCCDIYSVKRLSDGEVFTVGDELEGGSIIEKFEILADGFWAVVNDWRIKIKNLKHTPKQPTPLFKTSDGKDVFEGDEYWFVGNSLNGVMPYNATYKGNYPNDYTQMAFSTKSAALEYIANNKKLYSLEDVRLASFPFYPESIVENLKKLNQ